MDLTAFSTQATVEARASSARVKLWTDKNKDGTPDPDTLTQGFQFATGLIFEKLQQRYGETELASWTISTAPARILRISDDLCMWVFSSGLNAQNPLIQVIYDEAIQSLDDIASTKVSLYGATEGVTLTSSTEAPDDPFDRTYFNEVFP